MSDPLPIDHSFVPREQRESYKVGFADYIWKLLKFALITKIGAVAGSFVGGRMYGKGGAKWGYILAGLGTGTYEAFTHWKPIKGTQERIEALLPQVTTELDPDNLKKEVELQQQIQTGLAEREKLFTQFIKQRQPTSIEPRGTAVDALSKKAQAAEVMAQAALKKEPISTYFSANKQSSSGRHRRERG